MIIMLMYFVARYDYILLDVDCMRCQHKDWSSSYIDDLANRRLRGTAGDVTVYVCVCMLVFRCIISITISLV